MTDRKIRTIIQNLAAYQDYPFEAIRPSALKIFEAAAEQSPGFSSGTEYTPILRTLECYLQITSQSLSSATFRESFFQDMCRGYIGALYSTVFFSATLNRRGQLSRAFLSLLLLVKKSHPGIQVPTIELSSRQIKKDAQSCIDFFYSHSFDDEKIWLWQGWPSTDKCGTTSWLPFRAIYKRLGRNFTVRLYEACDAYVGGRRNTGTRALKQLAEFIGQYPKPLQSADLLDRGFITQFWREFLVYYIKSGYADGEGSRISTLVTYWRNHFRHLVIEHLIPSGLFAKPYGDFPMPPARQVSGAKTNIRAMDKGQQIKTKLLTHIPLHANDDEAMHLLFGQIQFDFDTLVTWAEWATKDMWNRYQRRLNLAKKGTVRKIGGIGTNSGVSWQTDRGNPEYLQNAAATLDYYGHIDRQLDPSGLLVARPPQQTAWELGLPTTGSLIPHCILLVSQHPAITPSFLENFTLFDKHGKPTGYVNIEGSHYLIGYKYRRGSRLAEQRVLLNDKTIQTVQQLIEITQSLRDYLKKRGDDNWRYLLLTCAQGFSYPTRLSRLASETSVSERVGALAESLGATSALGLNERRDLMTRFSLSSLRASAGVLVYLKTKSVSKMAEALGHEQYHTELLSRYLPQSIIEFFEERWIRIFQAGIIAESLKSSPFLVQASGFQSIDELDKFLTNHALKTIPADIERRATAEKHKVVFAIDAEILTTLLSLQQAVDRANFQASPKARYWAEIGRGLVEHIESQENYRDDFITYLDTARKNADPTPLEPIIYG